MANGTKHEHIARADRIREQSRQRQRGFENAMSQESTPPRDPFDSEAEITGNWKQVHLKGKFPRWALGALVVAAAVVLVALGFAKAWQMVH